MRRSFDPEVRNYVIVERYKGKSWKGVEAGVEKTFNIKPPSRRIMQRWFADYKGTVSDPTGVKFVSQVIEDAANEAKPLAQAKMMADVFPLWSYLQGSDFGLNVYDAGIVAMLKFYETQIGRENLDRNYAVYKEIRDKLPQQLGQQQQVPPGWTIERKRAGEDEKT